MADFKISAAIILKIEGGYSNDATDRGGETWKGIARKKNPNWLGWKIIDEAKTHPGFPASIHDNKELNQLKDQFYKAHYWDVLNLDQFKSQRVATEMFDISINMGPGIASVFLQRVINVYNNNQQKYKNIPMDGKIGPVCVGLINDYVNEEFALKVLNVLQGYRYIEICEKSEEQEKYAAGWILQRVKLD